MVSWIDRHQAKFKHPQLTCPCCTQNLSYDIRTVVTKGCHIVQVRLIHVVNLSQSLTALVLLIQTLIMNPSQSLIAWSVLTVTHNRQVLLRVIIPQHSRMIIMHGESDTQHHDSQESVNTAPEVWSESEWLSSDGAADTVANASVANVQQIFCLSTIFLQLYYQISERIIVYLLTLLGASMALQNLTLKAFVATFPKTLYSLRKQLMIKNSFVEYVACPSCHKL